MSISKDEFRAALGRFASGVTVVTVRDSNGNQHGITVSAFCSVSLEPPLILVCIDKSAGSSRAFKKDEFFAVHILREGQQHYSDRFASYLPDKFSGLEVAETADGLLLLKDALAILECRLVGAYDGGDHTIFVGQVENSYISDDKPLIYFHGSYRQIND